MRNKRMQTITSQTKRKMVKMNLCEMMAVKSDQRKINY